MAHLGDAGNTREVQDEEMNQKRGFRQLEAGWYRVALIEDEATTYDWGLGLNMQFQILTGDYENQRIFDFLCIEHHESEKAQHIARVKLRELAVAAGHRTPDDIQDTQPMYNKPIMVEVYRAKDDTKYAEDDGKRPRIGQFMSVTQWKAEKSDESMPGVERKKAAPPPVREDPPPPVDDSDIPF